MGYGLPVGVALGLTALARSQWTPGPGPGGGAVVIVAALVVVPVATGLLVQGTREALAALRALGWRAQPAEWLLAAAGAAGSALGLAAVVAFFGACLLDRL